MKFDVHIILAALLTVVVTSGTGCVRHVAKTTGHPPVIESYYSEMPYVNCSSDLEGITHSVKKVNCYATYRTYVFGENSQVTLNDLSGQDLLEKSQARVETNESVSGTALVISFDGEKIALLTCAHVAVFPDTLINWSEHSDLHSNRYIHSISLKLRQQLYVRDIPDGGPVQVLASSVKDDIALLGRTLQQPVPRVDVFGYSAGHSEKLEFGSFVYLVGFPLGQLMVTKGLVSKPSDPQANFMTDAPFNEGFSGGIALAVRRDVPELELVGMGRAVSARTGYSLKPEKQIHEYEYNPSVPYSGNIFVQKEKDMNYGMTFVIPVNKLRQFYNENRQLITGQGYNLDDFFLGKD
jgi:hypothetical protein